MNARIFTMEQFLQYFSPWIKWKMRTSYRQRNMFLTDWIFDKIQGANWVTYYFFFHNEGWDWFMWTWHQRVWKEKMNELLDKYKFKYSDEVIPEYLYETPCEFDLEEDIFINSDLFLFNKVVKLKVKVGELVSWCVFKLSSQENIFLEKYLSYFEKDWKHYILWKNIKSEELEWKLNFEVKNIELNTEFYTEDEKNNIPFKHKYSKTISWFEVDWNTEIDIICPLSSWLKFQPQEYKKYMDKRVKVELFIKIFHSQFWYSLFDYKDTPFDIPFEEVESIIKERTERAFKSRIDQLHRYLRDYSIKIELDDERIKLPYKEFDKLLETIEKEFKEKEEKRIAEEKKQKKIEQDAIKKKAKNTLTYRVELYGSCTWFINKTYELKVWKDEIKWMTDDEIQEYVKQNYSNWEEVQYDFEMDDDYSEVTGIELIDSSKPLTKIEIKNKINLLNKEIENLRKQL